MSARNIHTTSLPLFLVLLGALAFNLSSWPEAKSAVQSTSMSSQLDTCGIVSRLDQGEKSAACSVHDEVVSGTVSAEYKPRTFTDKNNQEKVVDAYEVTIQMAAVDADLDRDGAALPQGWDPNCKCYKTTVSDLKQAGAEIDRQTQARKAAVERRKKEKTELADARERCEKDDKGKDITTEDGVLRCKIAKLKKMPSQEAAAYYDEEIQPRLQEMVGCSMNDATAGMGGLHFGTSLSVQPSLIGSKADKCSAIREKGLRLLQEVSKFGGRNRYISESIKDLRVFGLYNKQMDSLYLTYGGLPANDPRRRGLGQQISGMQAQWNVYANQRGLALSNMRNPMGWDAGGFSLAGGLTGDLSDYSSEIGQSYMRIAQLHQQYLSATGRNDVTAANTVTAGQMRGTSRGMPSSSYAGGPSNNSGGSVSSGSAYPRGGFSTQSVGSGRGGGSAPTNGKPRLGDRVN